MKTWTIGRRVALGFGTLLILVLALALTNGFLLHTISSHVRGILQTAVPGMQHTARINNNTALSQACVLRHIAAKTAEEKKACEDTIAGWAAENEAAYAGYEKTLSNSQDRSRVARARELRTQYAGVRARVFELSRAGKREEAEAAFDAAGPILREYQTICDTMFKDNCDLANRSGALIQQTIGNATLTLSGVTVAAFLLGGAFALIIVFSLKRVLSRMAGTLQEGSHQMLTAASQVTGASQSLAQGSSQQAASLEETSASLEQIASMVQRNAENARNAKDLANQTRSAADTGALDMKEMSQAMGAIKTSSDNIAKIIKTIDEIAFQTNILALNAAVEAARAGEAGMGFAVVADEVRNLAQRSAQAARETAEKIEDSIHKSEEGVRISTKVQQSLAQIVDKARQVDELVAEIAAASHEQSQGILQVNNAVGEMDHITQSSAHSAEETAIAAHELNTQAQALKGAVESLIQLVGQGARPGAVGPVPKSAPAKQAPAPRQSKREKKASPSAPAPAPASSRAYINGKAARGSETPPTLEREVSPLMAARKRNRELIPMEGDFKDF